MLAAEAKSARLEARVTPDQKRLIERAAELTGNTVTAFLVTCVHRAAIEAIRDSEELRLNDNAREVFVRALVNPPAPNAAAMAAARRYMERTK